MLIQIVKSPTRGTMEMLARRRVGRGNISFEYIDAIGLVQGKLAEMIVAADIAEKAADVRVEEIRGVCPQHFVLIALFGDTASVETALNSIKEQFFES